MRRKALEISDQKFADRSHDSAMKWIVEVKPVDLKSLTLGIAGHRRYRFSRTRNRDCVCAVERRDLRGMPINESLDQVRTGCDYRHASTTSSDLLMQASEVDHSQRILDFENSCRLRRCNLADAVAQHHRWLQPKRTQRGGNRGLNGEQ